MRFILLTTVALAALLASSCQSSGGGDPSPLPRDGGAGDAAADAGPPGEADGGLEPCEPDGGECPTCGPGERRCEGTVSMVCAADGSGFVPGRDCEEWSVACGDGGFCEDDCAEAEATLSYVGCEYYASPLAQTRELDERRFDFRIVVTNPNPLPAELSVWRGHLLEARRTLVPGAVTDIPLPWIDGVSFGFGPFPWSSTVVEDGAYRVLSDRPVIVSQFNPFHYESDGVFSYTNDASLLLPVHALGQEHVAVSYLPIAGPSGEVPGYPGWMAVVGTSTEPTTVQVVASAHVAADAGGRWPATAPGQTLSFTLARGEVATVAGAPTPPCDETRPTFDPDREVCVETEHDVSGSRVLSDRPVAVFSGHTCAYVPVGVPACDHLETQLAPASTWGRRFETLPLREPGTLAANLLRIVAARDGTRVTLDPPVGGATELELAVGGVAELTLEAHTSIVADGPIQVAQLMLGQHSVDPALRRGDPALTILVPAEQFRRDYAFVTPRSYAEAPGGQSYVLLSRAPGVQLELDGAPVEASWTAAGGRELAIVPVGGGAHHARSAAPFGVIAFGLGSYTSFAYPAGLDLKVLLY